MTSIYILRLMRGKYYVGKTTRKNPLDRIKMHFKNGGSKWTQKYPPVEIEKIVDNCDNFDEDKYTKIYMSKYGINNVRGASFCTIDLKKDEINLLEKSLLSADDGCYKCGMKGHFISNCPDNNNLNNNNLNNNNNNK